MAIFDWENRITYDLDTKMRSDDRYIDEWIGASVFLDYAGIKDSIENCYACAVAILWEKSYGKKPTAYIYRVIVGRGNREDQLSYLVDLYDAVLPIVMNSEQVRVVVEDVVDPLGDIKENFLRTWEVVMEKRNLNLKLEFLNRSKNKKERITRLEAPINNGDLCFPQDLPSEYVDQIRDFPLNPFFDCPDATEGAWSCPVMQSASDRQSTKEKINFRIEQSEILEI